MRYLPRARSSRTTIDLKAVGGGSNCDRVGAREDNVLNNNTSSGRAECRGVALVNDDTVSSDASKGIATVQEKERNGL